VNRTETIHQLENLLQNHEEDCNGCKSCDEIARLRGILDNNNDNNPKVQQILAKGTRMTKSDIAYLIGKDVLRKDIRRALRMDSNEFFEMMVGWGFSKKRKGDDGEMGKLKEFTVEEYNDLKANGLNDEQICEKKGIASLHYWKKKNGLIGTTLRSEKPKPEKTITAVGTPPKVNTPEPDKQQPEQSSKSRIEVMEKAIKQKDEEYQLLKENTVPFGDYATMKSKFDDSESGRQLYMYKWEQAEGKYQQTFSNLEKMDHELENTKEQLRKVRDYNVKATEKIQHLEALLMMYMGEGKAE
jgi:hypothetical protein